MIGTTDIEIPGYLCRIVSEDDDGRMVTDGSGILLDSRHLLTARHVVQRCQRYGGQVEWGQRKPSLRVRCQGCESKVEEIIPDDHGDIALVRLATGMPGPYAVFLNGVPEPQGPRQLRVPMIYMGYRAEADVQASATVAGWMTSYAVHWDADTGEPEDLQFDAGAPAGLSGGPVCTRFGETLGVVAMLYLGGESAATSRAYALARLREFLSSKDLEIKTQPYPTKQYEQRIRAACIELITRALVGWCPDPIGLLANAFFGYRNDPRPPAPAGWRARAPGESLGRLALGLSVPGRWPTPSGSPDTGRVRGQKDPGGPDRRRVSGAARRAGFDLPSLLRGHGRGFHGVASINLDSAICPRKARITRIVPGAAVCGPFTPTVRPGIP